MAIPVEQRVQQLTDSIEWMKSRIALEINGSLGDAWDKFEYIRWILVYGGEDKIHKAWIAALQGRMGIAGAITNLTNRVQGFLEEIRGRAYTIIFSIFNEVITKIDNVGSIVARTIIDMLPALTEPIKAAIRVVEDVLTDQIASVGGLVKASFEGITGSIQDGFVKFEATITPLITGVRDVVRDNMAVIPQVFVKLLADLFLEEVPAQGG